MIVKVNINNILAKMQLFILLAYPNNITFLYLERGRHYALGYYCRRLYRFYCWWNH